MNDFESWWNEMNEDCRRFWLRAAVTSVPAEAWSYYRRVMIDGLPF